MTGGPPGVTRRRWRTGTHAAAGVANGSFLLLVAAAFVSIAVDDGAVGIGCFGGAIALLAVPYLLASANGLRSVRIEGDPPVLSVPTLSFRHGFGRRSWPLDQIVRVEMVRRGLRYPYYSAQIVSRRDKVTCDSITCSNGVMGLGRGDVDTTSAGRAVAEIRAVVEWDRPW